MNKIMEIVENQYPSYSDSNVNMVLDIDINKKTFLPVGEKIVMVSTCKILEYYYETMCFVVDLDSKLINEASTKYVLWGSELGLERTEGLDIEKARINHVKAIHFFEDMNNHYIKENKMTKI